MPETHCKVSFVNNTRDVTDLGWVLVSIIPHTPRIPVSFREQDESGGGHRAMSEQS